ncbi:hypothetical protein LZ318_30700 [Saccharopolyspora indica]|uniref:hypothetical protein n=1 Tax=Saccharopolyspora indica TaxID=1229659 RepID=UPI0022EACB6A|nr:hypothetical protein [Saccharopolyspora indica]MDA3644398.1 hypothetical protein [Saccharopolyspora indica]
MWPFDDIGGSIGDKLKELVVGAFDSAMQAIWDAALWILREVFKLVDEFSVFTVDTRDGPVGVLWPMMLWISGTLALGLFFWQLTVTNLRGGRGFMRLVGGPVQYGIALAVTVGVVAALLAASDGLTNGILTYGLQSSNFTDALEHTSFGDGAVDGIKAVVLGLCAIVGVIPASIGYVLEMLFREAAIYVLVGTIPVTAAGLLANVTKGWYWTAVRWIVALVFMKPVLGMTLVLGVAIAGGSQGLSGLLAGIGVLIIALFVPFVLFRLLAFVDPNSDAGAAFRDALSSVGVDSYGGGSPAFQAARSTFGGGDGGGDAQEDANTARFDQASGGSGSGSDGGGDGDDDYWANWFANKGKPSWRGRFDAWRAQFGSDPDTDTGGGGGGDGGHGNGDPDSGPDDGGGDDDTEPPEPPDHGGGGGGNDPNQGGGPRGGGGGPKGGGGGGGPAPETEAAVVL